MFRYSVLQKVSFKNTNYGGVLGRRSILCEYTVYYNNDYNPFLALTLLGYNSFRLWLILANRSFSREQIPDCDFELFGWNNTPRVFAVRSNSPYIMCNLRWQVFRESLDEKIKWPCAVIIFCETFIVEYERQYSGFEFFSPRAHEKLHIWIYILMVFFFPPRMSDSFSGVLECR